MPIVAGQCRCCGRQISAYVPPMPALLEVGLEMGRADALPKVCDECVRGAYAGRPRSCRECRAN